MADSVPTPIITPSSLEAALVALQKAFSRVSRDSAKVNTATEARALIHGPVAFAIKLRVDLQGDVLMVAKEGSMEMSLNGQVFPDIRLEVKPPASGEMPPPPSDEASA